MLSVWAEERFPILSVTLLCRFSITPPASPYCIPSQPRQIPSALFTAPTQPFSGLCHLIHGEDDSRSATWGVRAAEEYLSLPLHIHNSAFAPSSSSLPFSFPPVSFLTQLLLLLLTAVCTPAQHPQPEVSVFCKAPIWNSTSSCTGKVRAKQSATFPSRDSEFVVCEIYDSCMHLLKSCGWFAS